MSKLLLICFIVTASMGWAGSPAWVDKMPLPNAFFNSQKGYCIEILGRAKSSLTSQLRKHMDDWKYIKDERNIEVRSEPDQNSRYTPLMPSDFPNPHYGSIANSWAIFSYAFDATKKQLSDPQISKSQKQKLATRLDWVGTLLDWELGGYTYSRIKYLEERGPDQEWTQALRNDFLLNPVVAESLRAKSDLEVPKIFSSFLELAQVDNLAVLKIKVSEAKPGEMNVVQRRIYDELLKSYARTVQVVYRKKGTIPNDVNSGLKMVTGWNLAVQENIMPETIYLAYEKPVWNSIAFRMNEFIQSGDIGDPRFWESPHKLIPFNPILEPLFPTFGVSIFRDKKLDQAKNPQVEIRRLFYNRDFDPLGLLPGVQARALDISKFYELIVTNLPTGTTMIAKSHDPQHLAMFQRYGFKIIDSEISDFWGSEPIATVVQTRENFLSRRNKAQ